MGGSVVRDRLETHASTVEQAPTFTRVQGGDVAAARQVDTGDMDAFRRRRHAARSWVDSSVARPGPGECTAVVRGRQRAAGAEGGQQTEEGRPEPGSKRALPRSKRALGRAS